jgi:hypothetical protein
MINGRQATRGPVIAPLRRRTRQRWAIALGVALCWLAVWQVTSFVTATVLLVVLGGLFVGLRALGITRDHPWLRHLHTRPWRDGRDVLSVALRHLPEVFVVTPNGSLIAPDLVELRMNPGDLASLNDWMELDVVSANLTDFYEAQAAKRGARFAGSRRPEMYVIPDDSLPRGRYRLRRGLPEGARYAPGSWNQPEGPDQYAYADQGYADHEYADEQYAATAVEPADAYMGRTVMDGLATIMEQVRPAVPVLRLVTGTSVAETSTSGARAGRGAVELELPDVRTVSRVHATFTFAAGHWWVTSQGMNGLSVNGVQVSAKQALSDGDSIRWGTSQDAPLSRVEIG